MGNLSENMKIITKEEHELLVVESDKQGKSIIYTTPTQEGIADSFRVGISWKSLQNLYERSKRSVFEWVIRDKSLVIIGKENNWSIKFYGRIPNLSVDLFLSEIQTELMKNALFDKDFFSNIDR